MRGGSNKSSSASGSSCNCTTKQSTSHCQQEMYINTHPDNVSNYVVVHSCKTILYRSNVCVGINLCYLGQSIQHRVRSLQNTINTLTVAAIMYFPTIPSVLMVCSSHSSTGRPQ